MSWASQDSSQCSSPATGAVTPSAMSSGPTGEPFLSPRITSALNTPTPMNARTRRIPRDTVIASNPFHGMARDIILPEQAEPAEPFGGDDALGRSRFLKAIFTPRDGRIFVDGIVNDNVVFGAVLCLLRHQPGADAALRHQRVMRAAFDNPAMVENENPVTIDDAGQAVRQDQRRPPPHQPVQCLLDHGLVLRLPPQGLVQDQDRRIPSSARAIATRWR